MCQCQTGPKNRKKSKRVQIAGIDDKQQITPRLTVSASGRLLPAQEDCISKVIFPSDWHVINYWANEDTML